MEVSDAAQFNSFVVVSVVVVTDVEHITGNWIERVSWSLKVNFVQEKCQNPENSEILQTITDEMSRI